MEITGRALVFKNLTKNGNVVYRTSLIKKGNDSKKSYMPIVVLFAKDLKVEEVFKNKDRLFINIEKAFLSFEIFKEQKIAYIMVQKFHVINSQEKDVTDEELPF